MILWKKFGVVHVGTTDGGWRYEIRRRRGVRWYCLTVRNERGNEVCCRVGFRSVCSAKAAAEASGRGVEVA